MHRNDRAPAPPVLSPRAVAQVAARAGDSLAPWQRDLLAALEERAGRDQARALERVDELLAAGLALEVADAPAYDTLEEIR